MLLTNGIGGKILSFIKVVITRSRITVDIHSQQISLTRHRIPADVQSQSLTFLYKHRLPTDIPSQTISIYKHKILTGIEITF